ncbi:MAG: hypothetical protein NTW72_09650 [Gemmatimonadetes bacterium]|nr:hypothetical protein [Gemmatimonadota bacterium]
MPNLKPRAMHRHLPVLRASVVALALIAIGTLAAAGPLRAQSPSGTIIQVRDLPGSPIVWVVAWNAAEPAFGLSTSVRRFGAPDRYHRLWVSLDWPGGRDVAKAQGFNRPLPVSTTTETQNCFNGTCTPSATFGARLTDGPFRATQDDVPVKFVRGSGDEFTITLRRRLIDAYLGTVDSVAAALKK